MKCSNCGKEIANDSQFCEFCGLRIIQETKSNTSNTINRIPLKGEKTPKIRGIDGMTLSQISEAISHGAKFVYYPFTLSLVIKTIVISSNIYFIRTTKRGERLGMLFWYMNLMLGWWGIPFGPIYTITNMIDSFRGIDVTEATLSYVAESTSNHRKI